MSESEPRTIDRSIASVLSGRLSQARWTIAAAAIAISTVTIVADGSWVTALVAFAVVVAAAALAPRRTRAMRRADVAAALGQMPIDRLSALRLAAAVPDPLIVFDRTGQIVHANPAAEVTFGQVLRGVDLQLRFRAPEMQELIRDALSGTANGNVIDYSERLPIERLYRVSATPIGEGTGLFVLVFKDQSEVRRIDRMRADFIANASHELRTPLASIAGFIETLRGPAKDDPKATERFLEIMQAQTSRMARLIDDLLSLSRLEMKPFVKPGEKVDIVQVVGSVADALGQLAADAGVAVERDFPAEPITVPGNRDELTQVFENLLENAIKYGQSGRRVVLAIARSETGPHPQVDVTVRDFGPGIAEEHIPRITERFYRVDVDSSRAQKGTGLGLSIVKHILTRHNARLSIASKLGEGALFTVHLPAG
jgi:two-component system, OmpR family, phosphate regulon sensor histidine kinase PhoR